MFTLESKFSDFVKLFVERGACSDAKPYTDILVKESGQEDPTCEELLTAYEKIEKKDDSFVSWFVTRFGEQLENKFRLRYISTITHPMIALNILKQCPFLTEEELFFLKTTTENITEIQKMVDSITVPMEAARMLIDCPNLTDEQEFELKTKFEGLLPTVEKELSTGIILTAKSQVSK